MLGSTVLEIAIGLVFIYFAFATICSAIHEWIVAALDARPRTLREGIERLLGNNLGKAFYNHPLIKAMFQGSALGDISADVPDPLKLNFLQKLIKIPLPWLWYAPEKGRPTYIDSQTFARVLLDLITPADHTPAQASTHLAASLKTSAADTTAAKMSVSVKDPAKLAHEIDQARAACRALLDTRVPTTLAAAAKVADPAHLEAYLRRVEAWYNQSMDRLSGQFKRKAQQTIAIIGLMIAGALNVDTLAICDALIRQPALRATVIASAEQEVAKPAIGKTERAQRAEEVFNQLSDKIGLPIGWWNPAVQFEYNAESMTKKFFGILLTVIALSMGAPFWFDLLNKLVNIRAAGKKPATPAPAPSVAAATPAPTVVIQANATNPNAGDSDASWS